MHKCSWSLHIYNFTLMFPRKRTGNGGTGVRAFFLGKKKAAKKNLSLLGPCSQFLFCSWCDWVVFLGVIYFLCARCLDFCLSCNEPAAFFALIDCSHLAAFFLLAAARRELFLACIVICTRAVFAAPAAHWLVQAARLLLIRLLATILSLQHALKQPYPRWTSPVAALSVRARHILERARKAALLALIATCCNMSVCACSKSTHTKAAFIA